MATFYRKNQKMALTPTRLTAKNDNFVNGNKKVRYREFAGPSSYTTGGESITPSSVGLKTITFVSGTGAKTSGGTGAFITLWDYTNNKLLYYTAAGSPGSGTALAEVASTTNLSTYTVRLRIEGTG